MSTSRPRRLPIACEPCRKRKIRCPRDAVPCGSCIRRGVSPQQCQFAKQPPRLNDNAQRYIDAESDAGQPSSLDAIVADGSGPTTNSDLARRVHNLEQQFRRQGEVHSGEPASLSAHGINARRVGAGLGVASDLGPTLHGRLVTDRFGYVRFIRSLLSSESSRSPHDLDDTPENEAGDRSVASPTGPFPIGESEKLSCAYFVSLLPPKSHCTTLVDTYLSSVAPLFHILHLPTFREQYASFTADPESVTLSWIALLFTVVGTAVYAMDSSSHVLPDLSRQSDLCGQVSELSERYRSLALKALEADHYLWNYNMTTLQTLVLLIHSITHSHGQTWTLLGLTYHLAVSIGCHVDPSTFNLDAISCEERRRCWYGLMLLYESQNTVLGHIGLPKSQIPSNTRPPTDIDDEDLIAGQFHSPASPVSATRMSYLLLEFRLCEISSQVCSLVTSAPDPPYSAVKELDDAILREQTGWTARYGQQSQYDTLPAHHRVHLNVLWSFASHITLLLHHRSAVDKDYLDLNRDWSQRRILESATQSLSVHAALYDEPEFGPFAWYNRGLGSFHAFHAAVLITAVFWTEEAQRQQSMLRLLLQSCLQRFEAMRDASSICKKAASVLERMLLQIVPDSSSVAAAVSVSGELGTVVTATDLQEVPDGGGPMPSAQAQYEPAMETDYFGPDSAEMNALLDQMAVQHWFSPVTFPYNNLMYSTTE